MLFICSQLPKTCQKQNILSGAKQFMYPSSDFSSLWQVADIVVFVHYYSNFALD